MERLIKSPIDTVKKVGKPEEDYRSG